MVPNVLVPGQQLCQDTAGFIYALVCVHLNTLQSTLPFNFWSCQLCRCWGSSCNCYTCPHSLLLGTAILDNHAHTTLQNCLQLRIQATCKPSGRGSSCLGSGAASSAGAGAAAFPEPSWASTPSRSAAAYLDLHTASLSVCFQQWDSMRSDIDAVAAVPEPSC